MSTSKHINKICCTVFMLVLLVTFLFTQAEKLGVQAVSSKGGYASRLFDTSTVHTIDIVMDDWDDFIKNCTDKEYVLCTLIIDDEVYKNAAIRAKGNTSLSSVDAYGNDRYSFKIEFDHYDSGNTYHGLDKLCLNNIIQDNTYMKDYLSYQMMRSFGVDAPLCSYSYITVNGEDWGLYLAVEGIEDAFLQRSYGNDYGALYKPDSMDMGGGRGNDMPFDMEKRPPDSFGPDKKMSPDAGTPMGSDDVSLLYTDDEYESYSNILENAKTTVSDSDKSRLIRSLKQLNEGNAIDTVVNIDEVIRYFVVHNFVLNFDSYTGSMLHNYYLYEKDGMLSMIPWDYNLAFGGFLSESDAVTLINYPIDTPVSGGTIESRPMLAWIFNNDTYTELYHQYFSDFITEYFENDYIYDLIDDTKELIDPFVEKDPTSFCTYEEFENGVSVLKEFCMLRAQSISRQLSGTIPATSAGQAMNVSALIDDNDINIAAMGSMESAMPPGQFQRPD
ncbi:MAG: spore coat protein CotH [Lachnospiraceae bacterium]|nr:spore coat protein CotH [Lachnospiraceae bacterium]